MFSMNLNKNRDRKREREREREKVGNCCLTERRIGGGDKRDLEREGDRERR